MEFHNILRNKRKDFNLTQQELADQLHVTRQTLSRWENDLSYPNLDTLIQLGEILDIPLDNLLKGGENQMVKQLSNDVRDKRKYGLYLRILLSFLILLIVWLVILGYGRATQNQWIDFSNPFLKTQYGYAILPGKVSEKKQWSDVIDSGSKDSHGELVSVPQKVDAFVSDSPLGSGSWLKFSTGRYNKNERWALIAHKGSYVYSIRLLSYKQIPLLMREQVGTFYVSYNSKSEPRLARRFTWWPFN
ncbi:helix-turn-helix transcriptional regulator [Lactobacillus sp. UCMA15818]|uniref:helix-turn-helix domain-containing protein n=1 Tax=Lactobacillus sp. UCMA15818 TaxID=2583394 RepID=UPI0025B0C0F1|nr:helix-turn-helix transcriptional regulator [Lactobacillus sp. UCMA15818]MDN2453674.1 helix-turn-helix transcriptional regulator [Lactobacillus sp. UCMA15818]